MADRYLEQCVIDYQQKIKEELEKKFDVFPGQINITVVREFRAISSTKI